MRLLRRGGSDPEPVAFAPSGNYGHPDLVAELARTSASLYREAFSHQMWSMQALLLVDAIEALLVAHPEVRTPALDAVLADYHKCRIQPIPRHQP